MKYAVNYETMVGDVGPIVTRRIYLTIDNNIPNRDDINAALVNVSGPRYHITQCEIESDEDDMIYAYESFF